MTTEQLALAIMDTSRDRRIEKYNTITAYIIDCKMIREYTFERLLAYIDEKMAPRKHGSILEFIELTYSFQDEYLCCGNKRFASSANSAIDDVLDVLYSMKK